jgi:hypothetical protein
MNDFILTDGVIITSSFIAIMVVLVVSFLRWKKRAGPEHTGREPAWQLSLATKLNQFRTRNA